MKAILNNMWAFWFTTLAISIAVAWVVFELFMKNASVIE